MKTELSRLIKTISEPIFKTAGNILLRVLNINPETRKAASINTTTTWNVSGMHQ